MYSLGWVPGSPHPKNVQKCICSEMHIVACFDWARSIFLLFLRTFPGHRCTSADPRIVVMHLGYRMSGLGNRGDVLNSVFAASLRDFLLLWYDWHTPPFVRSSGESVARNCPRNWSSCCVLSLVWVLLAHNCACHDTIHGTKKYCARCCHRGCLDV